MLNYYQKQIQKVTKCSDADAAELETIMRQLIFKTPLDGLSAAKFNQGAKDAKDYLDYTRTPEGMTFVAQVEREMLGV
jgi:hypothetical protein